MKTLLVKVFTLVLCGAFLSSCAWKGTGKSPSFSVMWTQGLEFRASGVDVDGGTQESAEDETNN